MKIVLGLFALLLIPLYSLGMHHKEKKRQADGYSNVAKKPREQIFCIPSNPHQGLLACLKAPANSQCTQPCTLQIAEKEYRIEQRVAELSATLKNILTEMTDRDAPIPISSISPKIAPCLIECLKRLVLIKDSLTYGDNVHAAINDLVDKTDIIHLFLATSYLDIPVLFHYVASVIATYLGQEQNMKRLGDFLECLNEELPADLQRILIDKFLKANRGILMKFYNSSCGCKPLGAFNDKLGCNFPSFGDASLVLSRVNGNSLDWQVFEVKDGQLVRTKIGNVLMCDAIGSGFFNSQGTKLVFDKRNEGMFNSAKYLVELEPPLEYVPIDPGASFSYKSDKSEAECYVHQDYRQEIRIIDPNYPQTLTFLGISLTAYNGAYALTEKKLGGAVYLWHIEPTGNPTLLKELPSLHDSERDKIKLRSPLERLLSRCGRYFISLHEDFENDNSHGHKISYCDLGNEPIIWKNLSLLKLKNLPSLNDKQDFSTKGIIFHNIKRFLALTRTGLLVLTDNGLNIYLLDIHTKKGISFTLQTKLHRQCDKVLVSADESQLYGIAGTRSLKTLKIDLFHNLRTCTLSQLVCILHEEKICQSSGSLKKIYDTLPDRVKDTFQKNKQNKNNFAFIH